MHAHPHTVPESQPSATGLAAGALRLGTLLSHTLISQLRRQLALALLLALTAGLLGTTAQAVTVQGLYDARVPLADSSDEARRAATELAMRVVLTKLSGSAQVPARPGAAAIIESASEYLEQYQVVQADDGLAIEVVFNQRALDLAMDSASLPRWSNERPETLVWFFVNLDGTWTSVSPNRAGQADLVEVVTARAANRGLPVIWPLFDAADTEALSLAASTGDTIGAIDNASQRYAPNAHVYLSLVAVGAGFFEAQWVLRLVDGQETWSGQGTERDLLLEEAVNALADAVAGRFVTAQGAGVTDRVAVQVAGIELAVDYGRLLDYLDRLNAIENVAVTAVMPDRVELSLKVRGGRAEFERLIGLGRVIEPVPSTPGTYLFLR